MEQIKLKAILRAQRGKQSAKRMRREGLIPAVVYHRGEEPVAISVADKEMNRILRTAGGENVLINLDIEKEKKARGRSVIIKEIQHDPVKRHVLHVDFNEISLTEKILVEVEVVGQGEPVGVKQDGGVLDHPLRTLKVQCLPTDIPKHIDVDVSGLKLNESIHVKDITVAGTLKVLTDPEAVLFLVKLHEEKVEETPAEPQEVEVLTEKKEEEAPAAGAAGAEKGKEEPKAAEKTVKPEKK